MKLVNMGQTVICRMMQFYFKKTASYYFKISGFLVWSDLADIYTSTNF